MKYLCSASRQNLGEKLQKWIAAALELINLSLVCSVWSCIHNPGQLIGSLNSLAMAGSKWQSCQHFAPLSHWPDSTVTRLHCVSCSDPSAAALVGRVGVCLSVWSPDVWQKPLCRVESGEVTFLRPQTEWKRDCFWGGYGDVSLGNCGAPWGSSFLLPSASKAEGSAGAGWVQKQHCWDIGSVVGLSQMHKCQVSYITLC